MIIGLSGFKGSGKSVVAKYLEENHGFKRVNFKDALVAEMKECYPDTLKELGSAYHMDVDKLFENKPAAMRALMQNHGTDIRRKDDPDYWVKQYLSKVELLRGNIVTDDVRFFNELSAITELNGVMIRVVRDDITTGGTHQSETEQIKFIEDFTVTGVKGEHETVYKQIEVIINTLKNK